VNVPYVHHVLLFAYQQAEAIEKCTDNGLDSANMQSVGFELRDVLRLMDIGISEQHTRDTAASRVSEAALTSLRILCGICTFQINIQPCPYILL
jgi:hypothetical protein